MCLHKSSQHNPDHHPTSGGSIDAQWAGLKPGLIPSSLYHYIRTMHDVMFPLKLHCHILKDAFSHHCLPQEDDQTGTPDWYMYVHVMYKISLTQCN